MNPKKMRRMSGGKKKKMKGYKSGGSIDGVAERGKTKATMYRGGGGVKKK